MRRNRVLLVVGTVLSWGAAIAGTSDAQQILASPRMGGYTIAAQSDAIGAGGVGRPTVSPYANLYVADAIGMSGAYQTLVQPFVQQNLVNNSQMATNQRLQRQVSAVDATTTATRRPNQIIRNTGHQTRSLNYSHYYPTTTTSY